MTDSYIKHGVGGTLLSGPDAQAFFHAAVLSSALGLYASCGIIPTRGVTITRMLEQASAITKKKYKRGDAAKAQADVKAWADEMNAALPHIVETK